MKSHLLLTLVFVSGCAAVRAADPTATLTGTVSNVATGNLLEGARVEIPTLGLSVLTDNTGLYVLPALPAGAHEVVASYLGLDTARATVIATTGARAVRNFDLSTGIYRLNAFKVTGEREGAAAAVTAQRNADNVEYFNYPGTTITVGVNGRF